MTWDLSCPDWEDRLRTGRSLVPSLPLNLTEGDRAVGIFNRLRLADVPGTPRLGPRLPEDDDDVGGDAVGEWFRDIVRALFGSLDPVTRSRMIRELMLLVPKKNSKTSYGALLMLTALLMNQRPRAPFILTAPVQDTAEMAFNQVAGAIALDDVLAAKLHVRDHLKTIVHRETKAKLEIMTFDPAVLTGQKVAGALIDELHVVSRMSKADKAIRQLRGGMLPFPEAFLAFITTQSEDAPAGVFRAELIKARSIRDGKIKDTPMLPVLYELPEEMQRSKTREWREPRYWPMVTPNVGRSITIERLIQDARTAEQTSEAEFRAWASQHLNIEIGMSLAADDWAGASHWEPCAAAEVTWEYLLEHAEVITFGVDGGGLDDLLGASAIGRETGTGRWLTWSHAWCHETVLERRKEIAPRLLDFVNDGDLTIVEKPGRDVEEVADLVEQCEDSGLLDQVGVDNAGIGAIVDAIVDRGIEYERIVGIPQGYKLMGAIKTVERKLAGRDLAHGGRPLMNWCVGNAKPEPRGSAVLITKQVSGSAKIDPLLALFNAAALMCMNPKPRKKKYQAFFV